MAGLEIKTRRTMDDYQIGDKAVFTKTISESDVYQFAGISGDFYPLHINKAIAEKTRFRQRIAHGVLTTGLISTVLGTPLQGPGVGNAVEMQLILNFTAPVFFGDTITAEAEVIEKIEAKRIVRLKTVCRNQDGKVVIDGEAKLKLLKEMMIEE
jgi:3-hydroxybutyryl-CoA dehydratase